MLNPSSDDLPEPHPLERHTQKLKLVGGRPNQFKNPQTKLTAHQCGALFLTTPHILALKKHKKSSKPNRLY